MIPAWLALTATLSVMALLAVWSRRPSHYRLAAVLCLPLAACVAYGALLVPLGKPTASVPPGEYNVLGARIDIDQAIYVLLDAAEPIYVRLPYSKEAAERLQEAMNGEGDVIGDMTDEGEMQFHEAPVTAGAAKTVETPTYEVE